MLNSTRFYLEIMRIKCESNNEKRKKRKNKLKGKKSKTKENKNKRQKRESWCPRPAFVGGGGGGYYQNGEITGNDIR